MHQRCPLSSQHAHVAVDVSAETRRSNPADTLNHRCGVREPFDDTVCDDAALAASALRRYSCRTSRLAHPATARPIIGACTRIEPIAAQHDNE